MHGKLPKLCELLFSEIFILKFFERAIEETEKIDKKMNPSQSRLKEIDKELHNLGLAIGKVKSSTTLLKALVALEQEQEELLTQQSIQSRALPEIEQAISSIAQIQLRWNTLSDTEKRAIIHEHVTRIIGRKDEPRIVEISLFGVCAPQQFTLDMSV